MTEAPEVKNAKSKVTEEIGKIIERQNKSIDEAFNYLNSASKTCSPETVAIALSIGRNIERIERMSELYMVLEDQPEKDHHKVMARTSEQRDRLDVIVKQFSKGCQCQVQPLDIFP